MLHHMLSQVSEKKRRMTLELLRRVVTKTHAGLKGRDRALAHEFDREQIMDIPEPTPLFDGQHCAAVSADRRLAHDVDEKCSEDTKM